jgi:hypothetical protein
MYFYQMTDTAFDVGRSIFGRLWFRMLPCNIVSKFSLLPVFYNSCKAKCLAAEDGAAARH